MFIIDTSKIFGRCDSCGQEILVGDHFIAVSCSEQIAEEHGQALLTDRCSSHLYCFDCAGRFDYSRIRIRAPESAS